MPRSFSVAGGLRPPAASWADLHDPLLDQPSYRFAYCGDRSIARLIAKQAFRLRDTAIGAMGNVVVCLRGLEIAVAALPFLPWQIGELRLAAEPDGHRLGIAAKRQGGRRHRMKSLAHRLAPMGDRAHEELGDVVGMDMMNRLKAEIRQGDLFALGQCRKDLGVEVAGRIQRRPARPDDMPRMNDCRRKPVSTRRLDEQGLDGRLLDSIVAEGTARLHFRGRNLYARPMHPDRSRMQEMSHLAAQGFDQTPRARLGKTDHVDDDVRAKLSNFAAERPRLLLSLAIESDLAHEFPCAMRLIGLALAATDGNHLKTGADQPRRQISADMAAAADDHHARHWRVRPCLRSGSIDSLGAA